MRLRFPDPIASFSSLKDRREQIVKTFLGHYEAFVVNAVNVSLRGVRQ